MKAVLMSIRPQWCELIASGKKTVEVRKTKPKLELPFKCYIYCTRPKVWFKYSSCGCASNESLWLANGKVEMCDGFKYWSDGGEYTNLNGKVIGEFVCDEIDTVMSVDTPCMRYFTVNDKMDMFFSDVSCLDVDEVGRYLGFNKEGYGWHISDLAIYNKPKKLRDLSAIDKNAVKQCEYRERACNNPDLTNGAFLPGCYVCMKGEIDWCSACKRKPIVTPPQSWCYVEDLQ